MAKYSVKTSQFCALANEIRFQKWLADTAKPLYDKLLAQLKQKSGCSANIRVMKEVQQQLVDAGKSVQLIDFLLSHYPLVLRKEEEIATETQGNISEQTPKISAPSPTLMLAVLGKNEIFAHYNANLLTFPQKMVLQNGNKAQLERDVKRFVLDKVDFDYIILNDRAYIEYFKYKYRDEALLIPKQKREIAIYRQRHGIRDGN